MLCPISSCLVLRARDRTTLRLEEKRKKERWRCDNFWLTPMVFPVVTCLTTCLQFPLPLGGGTRSKKKKKKTVGRDALPDPYEPSWCFNVSVKEHTHFFLGLVPTPLMPKKKKGGGRKDHTRELQLLRRLFVGFGRACCYFLAVLYLLIEMD